MTIDRRSFLLAAPALLSGCTLAPGNKLWELLAAAESLGSTVARPFAHAPAKLYDPSARSASFPIRSLQLPAGYGEALGGWRLAVDGLVEAPGTYDLAALRARFPYVAETTRHDCVEGWSAIATWGGLRLVDLLAAVKPKPEARYVVCHAADFDKRSRAPFYGSLGLVDAAHPQVLLAYMMNDAMLTVAHGAPLRLRVPTQLGYKSTKFVHRIELVAELPGRGGYWEDAGYEHWAGI